ncbi:MAG: hypothetical protein EOO61_19860 [Hymenobacter sp.]|nr:MAG: hypothetical protein EOO61_19860 [Hymenobacter sp.]
MALDIPSLPTDNLHKFKAFVGLILAFGGLLYIFQNVFPLKEKAIDLKTQAGMLQVRSRTMNRDSLEINEIRIQGEVSKGQLNTSRLFWLSILFIPLSIYGLRLARAGFKDWAENQRLSDKLLQQQIKQELDKQEIDKQGLDK